MSDHKTIKDKAMNISAENIINALISGVDAGKISDGYHTFKELYDFRKVYNAALFNEWAKSDPIKYDVHKSWKHYDGSECFGGGWFVVVALLPKGQITNHYAAADWDLFKVPYFEKAKYHYDNHTSSDVLARIIDIL